MIYFVCFVVIYLLYVLLKLNVWICIALGVYAFLMVPFYQKRTRKIQEYQQRFYDVSLYLDTILYAFVKEEKVEPAVRDVRQALPDGKMKTVVEMAHDYLVMTYDEVELLEESLSLIDREYPCKRVHDVHKFMTHVEYYGGEIEKPVRLLLEDKGRWEQRIKQEMQNRKKQLLDVVLSVVASIVICSAVIYLPVMDVDISREWMLQILALLVIVANTQILFWAQKYLEVDWIGLQLHEEEEYYRKKMLEYENYDEEGQKRLSLGLGVIAMLGTGIAFCVGNQVLTMLGLLATLFFGNQHKIGKGLLERNLRREIAYAFPNWLLDMVLLLQSENVQVSLEKSKEFVPGVLRKELHHLIEELKINPESAEPYHGFLKSFEIPEVYSAMGILYSISIGNSGNADKQISELVEKNLELLDVTEKDMLRRQANGMQVLFLLPVLTASLKLMADMVVLMLRFLDTPFL